jgi:HK97 family phage major capsid protein
MKPILTYEDRDFFSESELKQRIAELDAEHAGAEMPKQARSEWNRLNELLDEFEARRERIAEFAGSRRNLESGDGADFKHDPGLRAVRDEDLPPHIRDSRDEALRANERAVFLPEGSREHMERELRADDDPEARLARYTVQTSNRDYFTAFARWFNDPISGPHTWSPDERHAVRQVQMLQRGLSLISGGVGGFLVPYELDPSILISSVGAVDPMRKISRVVTSAYNVKSFVSSLGVTSHWYADEAQISDDSPALLQPTITCRKAAAFVPVSFELFEDSDISTQIGGVFADSKAVEEARVFTLGNGSTEPKGIITAISAVGGSTIATATNTVAVADAYNNQNALPPRWRANAKFAANLGIINAFRQLPQATGLNYSIVNDSTTPPTMLGWQVRENSNMDGTLTASAADYGLISGDFNQFAIVDRVGTSIEFIPILVGANQRPTAQRGFLMHWRVGSDALIPDAFRLTNWSG